MKLGPLLIAAACLGLSGFGHAQDLKDTHGKTNAQILKMGYQKWYDFYTGKEGESTVGMSSAIVLYASALEADNDRKLARLGPVASARGKRIRKLLTSYMYASVDVGKAFTGGGTLWQINGASYSIQCEETIAKLTVPNPKGPSRVVSDVTRQIALLRKRLKSADVLGEYRKPGFDSVADMEKIFPKIVSEAKSLPRRQSDAVLEYCRSIAFDVLKN